MGSAEVSVSLLTNFGSVACGLLVVAMIVLGSLVKRELVDRVSLRLSLAISVVDVTKALVIILYIGVDGESVACTLVSFSIQWLTLAYLFLNGSILLNIQLICFHGVSSTKRLETMYWNICLLLPTMLLLPPLAAGRLGYDPGTKSCEYRDSASTETNIWLWSSYAFWVLAMCIYSTVIVIFTVVALSRKNSLVSRMSNPNQYFGYHRDVSRLVKRISLICLIPIATQAPGFIVAIKYYYNMDFSPTEIIIFQICAGSPGILNLLAFLLDPAFQNMFYTLKDWVKGKFYPSKPDRGIKPEHYREKPQIPPRRMSYHFDSHPAYPSQRNARFSLPQTINIPPPILESLREDVSIEEFVPPRYLADDEPQAGSSACFYKDIYRTELVRGL